jgi:hypothetical protein
MDGDSAGYSFCNNFLPTSGTSVRAVHRVLEISARCATFHPQKRPFRPSFRLTHRRKHPYRSPVRPVRSAPLSWRSLAYDTAPIESARASRLRAVPVVPLVPVVPFVLLVGKSAAGIGKLSAAIVFDLAITGHLVKQNAHGLGVAANTGIENIFFS